VTLEHHQHALDFTSRHLRGQALCQDWLAGQRPSGREHTLYELPPFHNFISA
jgi:hypothetical protein